jgi:hypothetical protein
MRVKPAKPGNVIRDPRTRRPLPAEGATVPDTTFWQRRLDAGEVVLVEGPTSTPTGLEPLTPLTTRGTEPDDQE